MNRLVIDGYGKFLGVENAQIVVREKGKVIHSEQPSKLRQVLFSGKGSLSTEAVQTLSKNGVEIVFIDFRGKVTARISPPLLRTVQTRREQYKAYDDWRSTHISRAMISAKVRNQASTLRTLAKSRKGQDDESAGRLQNAATAITEKILPELDKITGTKAAIDVTRGTIMGLEGAAGQEYWTAMKTVFPPEFNFGGRSGRGAKDPINAMLNYGYGILLGEVGRVIHLSGLDPYAGFLHADRPGKPSMVLDLMEEFRQHLVDKSVIKLVTKKQVRPEEGLEKLAGTEYHQLTENCRKALISEVLGRLETPVQYAGKSVILSDVILSQARRVAKFLRDEIKDYEGYYLRW